MTGPLKDVQHAAAYAARITRDRRRQARRSVNRAATVGVDTIVARNVLRRQSRSQGMEDNWVKNPKVSGDLELRRNQRLMDTPSRQASDAGRRQLDSARNRRILESIKK